MPNSRIFRPAHFCAGILLLTSLSSNAHDASEAFLGVDSNDNKISDVYEAVFSGGVTGLDRHADTDGDGMANEDEAAAGTNYADNRDVLGFANVTQAPGLITGHWRTISGKAYQMQASDALSSTWVNEGPEIAGNGTTVAASCPATGSRMFLRVRVSDKDTDADGATDWEELQAGTNPNAWDSDNDGESDLSRIMARLSTGSLVSVSARRSLGSENGAVPVEFQITRLGGLVPLSVNFSLAGTATPGTDYPGSATRSVYLGPGQNTAIVSLMPTADGAPESQETVTLTVNSGAGYTVGTASATGSIDDNRLGLLGQYFNSQETTYLTPPATNLNFNPANLNTTRIDPVVDFSFGGGAPAGTTITAVDSYGARWTGFLLVPTTGVYTFHAQMDRGAVLYVNGTAVITQWSPTQDLATAAPEFASANITLTAGSRIPLMLDFRESGTTNTRAEIHLSWTPPGGVKAVIPSQNLSPDPLGPTFTSSASVIAILGAPLTHTLVAPGATSFSSVSLPSGLMLNPTTGAITGIPGGSPGLVFASVAATNAGGTSVQEMTFQLIQTGGTITREVWTTVAGTGIEDIPLHTTANTTQSLTTLQAPSDYGDSYGERIRGYVTAPSTGLFTFYLTSDENAQLWVSANDQPARRLKRSHLTNASVAPGTWDSVSTQRSLTMRMTAGRRYYLEVLRREGSGADHLQVGWTKPGQVAGTSPQEIIPSWALSPYVPPTSSVTGGYLYAAVLTPQNGAASLGTGTAVLRVNDEKTEADLTVTWGNLTGSVTNSHIHDARSVPGPVGAIIFDIDDADPDRLLPGGDGLDPSEVYRWDIIGTGQHTYADVVASLEGGNSYINLHTGAYPNGEIRGFFQPVIGSQFFTPPSAPPAAELTLPVDATARKREVVRFLQQATFGAREDADATAPWDADSIQAVETLGYAGWIDAQLAMSPGTDPETLITQMLPTRTVFAWNAPTTTSRSLGLNNVTTGYNGSGPLGTFVKDWYAKWPLVSYSNVGAPLENSEEIWRAWWKTSVTAQDQLRHRVAFALSQIMVTSEDGELDELARGMAHYNDLLYYHGLGNFRTLLEKTTLSPIMGRYLDMLNNKKPNPATSYIPNENFAREILQLFSIGLRRTHPDGTLVLDNAGLPVATYEQPNVVGFAHVFTGWVQPGSGSNYVTPMTVTTSSGSVGEHDRGEKLLLEEAAIPSSPTGNNTAAVALANAELAASLDVIFHHPNTGPFISRQMIQRMVTANPSPGYIYRVAKVFSNNGSGVRGDMAAVVKALLLDPEARNASHRLQPGFGHLKEPVIRATQLLRAFNGFSYGEANYGSVNMLTTVLASPNTNLDLTQPLPGSDFAGSSSGASAIFSGDLIRLTGQTTTAENGYYTFNGIGQPLTPAATGTAASTYTTNVNILTGPAAVHVPLVEGISVGVNQLLLLRAQTNPAENGIYQVTALNAPLVRWSGADSEAELSNAVIRVGVYRDPATQAYSSNKTLKVDGAIATLGTSPVNIIDGSATSAGREMWNMGTTGGGSLFQTPLRAPTVFNFYEPDYAFLGDTGNAGLYSPEFQITSETSVINTANWLHDLTRRNTGTTLAHTAGQGYNYGGTIGRDIKMNVTALEAAAANSGNLVDSIAAMIMPGQITPRLRTLISDYVAGLPLTGTNILLPAASTWKYFTDAAGLGASDIVDGHASYSSTNWKHPNFADTAWSSGPAPLGYRLTSTPVNLNIATAIPYGPSTTNKWVSSYYRTEFNLASLTDVPSLTLRLKRDDGAIVYINGKEAWRSNFNTGAVVNGTTLATGAGDDGAAFFTSPVLPATLLTTGRNVVAVEIHQNSVSSGDVVFDLEINHPAQTSADRINRIGEALSILTLCPEFATQK